MEFERENPPCKFTIPDRITVRDQLEYFSLSGGAAGKEMLVRYWIGAQALIQTWDCELIPDHKELDIDDVQDVEVTNIIIWAGLQVRSHINNLDNIPKNS